MVCSLSKKTKNTTSRSGFTLIELLIVMAVIALLLAVLLPALRRARVITRRLVCQSHLRQIALAWHVYLDNNDDRFYQLLNVNHYFGGWEGDGGWDPNQRPLNRYVGLPGELGTEDSAKVFCCPADKGGVDCDPKAYLRFGNSYQTNLMLIGPKKLETGSFLPEPIRILNAAINTRFEGLRRSSVSNHSLLLLVGDNNWVTEWDPILPPFYRGKVWHSDPNRYNLAFLDGHVEFLKISRGIFINDEYSVVPFKDLYGLAHDAEQAE